MAVRGEFASTIEKLVILDGKNILEERRAGEGPLQLPDLAGLSKIRAEGSGAQASRYRLNVGYRLTS